MHYKFQLNPKNNRSNVMSDSKQMQHDQYSGPERRKSQRRSGKDQRDMIRFELDKDDRRSGNERRKSATSWGSSQPV
jgi:hypothetical protein